VILGVVAATASGTNGPPEKVTICHVAGLASDPANYITLHLPPAAVYGPGGHFNENGTPQAGHEQDSFGECDPPEPPVDECPNNPDRTEPPCEEEPPPPVDVCEDVPGNQPEGTVCHPVEPPVVVPPRCPPPNADGTYGGKDGKPGNDECKADPVPPAVVVPPTTSTTPPATTTTPPAATPPTTSSTGPVSKPKPTTKPKPDKPVTIVKVVKKPNGVVKIHTSDGKVSTGIMGSG
jgi:hypothetical protein